MMNEDIYNNLFAFPLIFLFFFREIRQKLHYNHIWINNLIKYLFYKNLLDESLYYKYFI